MSHNPVTNLSPLEGHPCLCGIAIGTTGISGLAYLSCTTISASDEEAFRAALNGREVVLMVFKN